MIKMHIKYLLIPVCSIFILFSCKTVEKTDKVKPVVKTPATEVITRLGINMLKSETMNAKQVKIISVKLYERLLSIKGGEYIAFKEVDGSKIPVNRQLTGYVDKLSPGYSISVKILNDMNGNIIYRRKAIVYEDIELDYTINSIAEDISGKLW